MTEEDRQKERAEEMLTQDGGLMMWALFVHGGLSGGKGYELAAKGADTLVELAKSKFT